MSVKGPVGGAEEEKTLRETVLPEGLREPLSFWADPDEILVWKRYTWGSFGQHDNIYTFVITPQLQTKAIFEVVRIKHLNKDSRKNYRRFTYVKVEDLLQLQGYILKIVFDEATSSKRRVTAHYLLEWPVAATRKRKRPSRQQGLLRPGKAAQRTNTQSAEGGGGDCMKFAVINSPANKLVLSYLGLRFSVQGPSLVFEADPSDLARIARTLRELGYAHDEYEAYRLAASFFQNEVRA